MPLIKLREMKNYDKVEGWSPGWCSEMSFLKGMPLQVDDKIYKMVKDRIISQDSTYSHFRVEGITNAPARVSSFLNLTATWFEEYDDVLEGEEL